jgi:hypothetical protein
VRVPHQHLHGLAHVARVPELHLAVVAGGDQREGLVGIVVNTPAGRLQCMQVSTMAEVNQQYLHDTSTAGWETCTWPNRKQSN